MTLNVNLIESGKCGNKKLIIYREIVLQKSLSEYPLNEFQESCSKASRVCDKSNSLLRICFYTTQTICFQAAFWHLCVHRGVKTLSDKNLGRCKGEISKPLGNIRRKQLECLNFSLSRCAPVLSKN